MHVPNFKASGKPEKNNHTWCISSDFDLSFSALIFFLGKSHLLSHWYFIDIELTQVINGANAEQQLE